VASGVVAAASGSATAPGADGTIGVIGNAAIPGGMAEIVLIGVAGVATTGNALGLEDSSDIEFEEGGVMLFEVAA